MAERDRRRTWKIQIRNYTDLDEQNIRGNKKVNRSIFKLSPSTRIVDGILQLANASTLDAALKALDLNFGRDSNRITTEHVNWNDFYKSMAIERVVNNERKGPYIFYERIPSEDENGKHTDVRSPSIINIDKSLLDQKNTTADSKTLHITSTANVTQSPDKFLELLKDIDVKVQLVLFIIENSTPEDEAYILANREIKRVAYVILENRLINGYFQVLNPEHIDNAVESFSIDDRYTVGDAGSESTWRDIIGIFRNPNYIFIEDRKLRRGKITIVAN